MDERPRNRLADATSPYLRQHASNPIDWYGWGPEALAKAKAEHKPILLSVGYSACHWCHVMAHESFEDPAVAAVINERFVSIKVDREERPDIDAIYQRVVQLMGEGGGWPLTVFLTPDGEPFYGGTYFPPQPRHGRPSFVQLATSLHDAWTRRPKEIADQAEQFLRGFAALASIVDEQAEEASGDPAPWESAGMRVAARRLLRRADMEWGGFGAEPKFPNPTALEIFARLARGPEGAPMVDEARTFLGLTLDRMYRGGMYDHLSGGFARYGTDRQWLVPHFEKMLYDNAQLLPLYAEAAVQWPDRPWLAHVARQTVGWLREQMRTPEGTFYAATDADSEGEEGKFFCWTPAQVEEVLGDPDRAARLCEAYGVTAEGNFEHGTSVLHLPVPLAELAASRGEALEDLEAALAEDRARLLAARGRRVPPARDDKVLTSWVALLVTGLCRTSSSALGFGDPELAADARALAVAAGERLVDAHVVEGQVMRAQFEGRVHTRGYLDDVAFLARACLDLHALTLQPRWRAHARSLAEIAVDHHLRPEHDGFFFTADDAEALIERTESQHDGPIPSGVGVIVEVLARLDADGDAPEGAAGIVEATLQRFHGAMAEPFPYASLWTAGREVDEHARHVEIRSATPDAPWARTLAQRLAMARLSDPHAIRWSWRPGPADDAIVCRGQVCMAPSSEAEAVMAALALNGAHGPR